MRRPAKLLPYLLSALLISASVTSLAQTQQTAPDGSPPVKEVSLAADAFVRGAPIPAWVKPIEIPATKRKNPVVIRLADTQLRAGKPNVVYVNRAVQVNDSSALSQIGQFQIAFNPSFQRVHLHRVWLLRGDKVIDQTKTVDVKFLQRESGLERGTYSGTVTASLLLADVRIGDTLHISYSSEGSNPVFGNTYSEAAGWDMGDPVETRHASISYPADRDIEWRTMGDFRSFDVRPVSGQNGNYRTLSWLGNGLEGVDNEQFIPDHYLPFRYVQFSEYKNWNAVAKWAVGLFPPKPELPAELRTLLGKLKALPDDEARTLAALRWVQEEIRYFSVSLGESSHRPHPPSEVVQNRYGDCKDKTYLLVTLLRELGIDAKPILVSIMAKRFPQKTLPMPDVFDHVIVQVNLNGKTWYLDGTRLGQRGRLQDLGLSLEGAYGLVVSPDTTDLTLINNPDANALSTVELSENFSLAKLGGTGKLQAKTTWYGSAAEAMRLISSQITPEQLRKMALTGYDLRYPGIELATAPVLTDVPEKNQFSLTSEFNVPELAKQQGDIWSIKYFPSNFQGVANIPQQAKRNFPMVVMSKPYVAKYKLNMEWPENVAVALDPTNRQVTSDFFTLDSSFAFRGNRAKLSLTLTTLNDIAQPSQITKFYDDIKRMDREVGSSVLINREALKGSGFFGLGKTTIQQTLQKRMQSIIERTTKTIDSKRLTGEDLAAAYCDRADAYSDLDQPAASLKDAQEAVKLAPQLARVWECRASAHFGIGDFTKANADYSKALSLVGESFSVFYRRGQVRYFLNKLPEAAQDFAKAAQSNTEGGDTLYADLWHIWTLQRLKQALPADLLARASKDPLGDWPRPALAMLIGKITPEQMLDYLSKKSADERELNLAEGYFYLGQHYLTNGKTEAAREAFTKARAQGITMYLEHPSAGFELKRLPAKQP